MKIPKVLSVLILSTVLFSMLNFLVPKPANADGMIIPPYDYWATETGQKALLVYDGTTEIMVVSIDFSSNAIGDFGWMVPVPNQPTLNKADSEIFDDLASLTEPKKNLLEKVMYPEDSYYRYDYVGMSLEAPTGAVAEDESSVNVVEETRIGILDMAVLTAGNVEDLEEWMEENGYRMPSETDTFTYNNYGYIWDDYYAEEGLNEARVILQDYIDDGWYFIVSKVDNQFVSDSSSSSTSGYVDPIRVSFETTDMIFPMKISSLSYQTMPITLYTITPEAYWVSNYDISGCDESSSSDYEYSDYYAERRANTCSQFEVTYGGTISSEEISDLTSEVGKGSWFESDNDMYIGKHYASYLSYEDMTEDVVFESMGNTKGLNDGSMTIKDWIKLPIVFVLYLPRNVFEYASYGYGGYYDSGLSLVLFLATIIGLPIAAVVTSILLYFLLKRTTKKALRVLIYALQFPAVVVTSLSVGVVVALGFGFLISLLGIASDVVGVDATFLGLQVMMLVGILFYRFQWRKPKVKK